jgi:HK97 family phage portal protein
MVGRENAPKRDLWQLSDEGYRQNLIVYRCIREIAESAAEPIVEARYIGSDTSLTMRHPLVRLLNRPNPEQSAFSLIESLVTYQQATGNWYLHLLRNAFGQPVELWPLRPDRMTVVPGMNGVAYYEYSVDGVATPIPIPAEDVIHDKLLDPLDDYYGLSPIEVAGLTVDLDNDAIKYLQQFFQNAATPLGIIKLVERVKRERRQEIKYNWETQFQGERGWHSVAVLDQDADYKTIGYPLKDLSLEHIFSETEARICAAFGVPPILIGAKLGLDRSTFANYAEARRSFWIETLKPIYRRISDRLTFSLAVEWSDNLQIGFDFSNVGALQEDKESLRKTALLSWDKGVITKNEARETIGYPRIEGGDVYKSNMQDAFIEEGDDPVAAVANRLLPASEGNGR